MSAPDGVSAPDGAGAGGGELHDRPSAAELVEAVREFLERDVMEATDGRVRFHTRVAVNVLAMVERELREGGSDLERHRERLVELGYEDDAALGRAIRAGELDDRAEQVRATVRAAVVAKLRVANPGYLEPDDR